MAQRIVTLCDVHARTDEDVAGATWSVTLHGPGDKATTWEVDLCEDDAKTLRDLGVMLDAVGRITAGPKRRMAASERRAVRESHRDHAVAAPGPEAPLPGQELAERGRVACPMDGCGKTAKNRKALNSHFRHFHPETTLAEVEGAPTPYACPECARRFTHATGLGAHRKQKHGVDGKSSTALRAGASGPEQSTAVAAPTVPA